VTIPAVLADATFSSIAVLGSNVVLLGGQSNAPASWRSDDGGASWAALGGGRDRQERVVAAGGRFIRISTPWPWEVPEIRFSTSVDGRNWRDGVARSLIEDGLALHFPRHVAATTDGVFLKGGAEPDFERRLDWCYVDLTACSSGRGLVVLHTAAGDTWRAIDVQSLLGPGVRNVAVADSTRGTIIAGDVRGRIAIRRVAPASWPAVTLRPTPPLPKLPPIAKSGQVLELGVVYRYPKHVHCGLTWLTTFNGRSWRLTRQNVEPQVVATLPQLQQVLLGTIRLTSPDTIEYSVGGRSAIAIYGPTDEPLPICI
jgi:hypothetical protein